MKLLAVVVGWLLILAGVALAAVVLESVVYHRRRNQEQKLYDRMHLKPADRWRNAVQRELE